MTAVTAPPPPATLNDVPAVVLVVFVPKVKLPDALAAMVIPPAPVNAFVPAKLIVPLPPTEMPVLVPDDVTLPLTVRFALPLMSATSAALACVMLPPQVMFAALAGDPLRRNVVPVAPVSVPLVVPHVP